MARRKSKTPSPSQAPPAPVASAPAPLPVAVSEPRWQPTPRVIAWLLILFTLALFSPAGSFNFINYDDPLFVVDNSHVQTGFTWPNIVWAFTNYVGALWHPLTWLTNILDCNLYGLEAGGHHLTNLVFHAGSAALLYLLLFRLTRASWPSAFVAALFAWHPLHVESVAWVAERKDVLSCFFWTLTLWCYVRYVERPGLSRYAQTLGCFVLGLMSKPMVVTLPAVLLLLDIWPLRRVRLEYPSDRWWPQVSWPPVRKLVLEKIPFFALGILLSAVTIWLMNRTGGLTSMDKLPLGQRLANTLVSYASYLTDVFWPTKLAVFYPFPSSFPWWQVVGATLLLLGISLAAVRYLRNAPWLLVGWLWFLVTLLPVIGLLQNGKQSMADRYTYIPYTGLFIILAWGVIHLSGRFPAFARWLPRLAGAVLLACVVLTTLQLQHWRNPRTLWTHVLKVTKENALAHTLFGVALEKEGKLDEAITHYREAIRIDPLALSPRINLGHACLLQGRGDDAIAAYRDAVKNLPDEFNAHHNLASLLAQKGELAEAIGHFRLALRLNPDFVPARTGLARALAATGQLDEAVATFREALRRQTNFVEGLVGLGEVLLLQNKPDEASRYFMETLRLDARHPDALAGLGQALVQQNRPAEAEAMIRRALLFKDSAAIRNDLANLLLKLKRVDEAIVQYRLAMERDPNWDVPLSTLAWLLATQPRPDIRNGALAVKLAERACEITRQLDSYCLTSLAAAYAETGRFPEAVQTAQKALQRAAATGRPDLAKSINASLRLYQRGQPYREPQ